MKNLTPIGNASGDPTVQQYLAEADITVVRPDGREIVVARKGMTVSHQQLVTHGVIAGPRTKFNGYAEDVEGRFRAKIKYSEGELTVETTPPLSEFATELIKKGDRFRANSRAVTEKVQAENLQRTQESGEAIRSLKR